MKFIEVTAMLLAMWIIETVIGIAVYRHASEIAYDGQMENYLRGVSRVADALDEAIGAGKTRTPDLSGSLSGTTLTLEGAGRTYAADATIADNLRTRSVNLYRLSEVCSTASADERIRSDPAVYVIYSEENADGTLALALLDLGDMVRGISPEGFGGIAVFSGSGRSEFVCRTDEEGRLTVTGESGDRTAIDELQKYRLSLDGGELHSARTVRAGDEVYALSVASLEEARSYTVGGYADFRDGQTALTALATQIILSMVGIGVLTAVTVYAGAYFFGDRGDKKEYLFTVDPEGMILRSNKRFAEDFPDVREIAERLNRFDEDRVYALRIERGEENLLLSCFVRKQFDGTVDVCARELTVPTGDDLEAERKDNMSAMFRAYSTDNGKVLLGEIYFNNLIEIKDVFGREFAETVRNLLLDRVRKQFESVFVIDYYSLGVLQPAGNRLDIMMRDMGHLVSELNRVVRVGDNNVLVSVKCGFAVNDLSVRSFSYDEVMQAADAALKRACEPQPDILNRVDYYIFQESQRKLYSKYLFRIDIPKMLEDGDFYLEYQPQYGLAEDRIVGFEALFRVQRRVQINASVMDIINYAERSGNMILLGNFILHEGMKFAKSIEGKGVSVSLNVSPVQMMQTGFVDNFLKIYRSYDLKPGSISVEITESYLVSDFQTTLKKLEVLRANGIDLHLDDFGTGYSSFGYLAKFPISAIKIDQSFVRDITDNGVNRLITRTIAEICHELKLNSICEGVERPDQLELVRGMGCDVIQGFLISRSVKEEVARDMIDHYHYRPADAEPSAKGSPEPQKTT